MNQSVLIPHGTTKREYTIDVVIITMTLLSDYKVYLILDVEKELKEKILWLLKILQLEFLCYCERYFVSIVGVFIFTLLLLEHIRT